MTDEQIIEMARQANLPSCLATHPKALKRFAKLVEEKFIAKEREEFAVHAVDIARRAVAEEREACAKVCDYFEVPAQVRGAHQDYLLGKEMAASQLADAIRARGKA